MKIFVSPTEKPNWIIDSHLFERSVRSEWTSVSMTEIGDENRKYSLEWTIGKDGEEDFLEGRLAKDGSSLVVESEDYILLYRFLIWCRKSMPEDESIIIYDENYSFNIELNNELTQSDFESLLY